MAGMVSLMSTLPSPCAASISRAKRFSSPSWLMVPDHAPRRSSVVGPDLGSREHPMASAPTTATHRRRLLIFIILTLLSTAGPSLGDSLRRR